MNRRPIKLTATDRLTIEVALLTRYRTAVEALRCCAGGSAAAYWHTTAADTMAAYKALTGDVISEERTCQA